MYVTGCCRLGGPDRDLVESGKLHERTLSCEVALPGNFPWWMDGEWMANGWRMDGEWWRMIWINYVLSLNGLTAASLEKWLIIGHCPDAARCFQLSAWIWKKQPTPDRWWNMMNYWLVFVDDVLPLIKSLLANVVVLTRSSSWIYRDNTTDSHSGELVLQIPGNIRYMTWILL
jgi:hypothetical protein